MFQGIQKKIPSLIVDGSFLTSSSIDHAALGSHINMPIISLSKIFPEAFTVSDFATLRALSNIFSIFKHFLSPRGP